MGRHASKPNTKGGGLVLQILWDKHEQDTGVAHIIYDGRPYVAATYIDGELAYLDSWAPFFAEMGKYVRIRLDKGCFVVLDNDGVSISGEKHLKIGEDYA